MKREVKTLLNKAIDSLVISIEMFNRPNDTGRCTASLIFMDHGFEMLLKAAIIHKGGSIREKDSPNTIGFDKCLRKALSDATVKFLTEDQALSLQVINGQRDAAQHYILDISEQQLYVHMQAGFTLFSDILKDVFDQRLNEYFPERVLPIATLAPLNIETLFRFEVREIRKLLAPNTRKRSEALARLRPMAILNSAILGEKNTQISEHAINKIADAVQAGKAWEDIFPGVARIQLNKEGDGSKIALRISKKADVEVALVKEGTHDASVVALRTVNELEYYNIGARKMAENIAKTFSYITEPKLLAVIKHLRIRDNSEYYKEIQIGKQIHKRFSGKAQRYLMEQIPLLDVENNWRAWK